MLKVFRVFLDRLAERLVVMSAGLVSSSVETLHAAGQAEQQSRLEDLARQYEADGKPEIAARLRERAGSLPSMNPIEQAVPMLENVTGKIPMDAETTVDANEGADQELGKLPDFSEKPNKPAKKTRRSRKSTPCDDKVE